MIRIAAASVALLVALPACGATTDVAVETTGAPSTRRTAIGDTVVATPTPAGTETEAEAGGPIVVDPAVDEPSTVEAPATFLPPEADAAANGLGDVIYDLPACPDTARGAVTDKANQRYWLCMDGAAVTDEIPMTTASSKYGLPPVGTYQVFARDENAYGIGGEALERFVAFYTTPKGNRIAFHEVVNQDPETVGDLDQRGASAGCFRVREADSVQVWEFLQIGDPVVVLTN